MPRHRINISKLYELRDAQEIERRAEERAWRRRMIKWRLSVRRRRQWQSGIDAAWRAMRERGEQLRRRKRYEQGISFAFWRKGGRVRY